MFVEIKGTNIVDWNQITLVFLMNTSFYYYFISFHSCVLHFEITIHIFFCYRNWVSLHFSAESITFPTIFLTYYQSFLLRGISEAYLGFLGVSWCIPAALPALSWRRCDALSQREWVLAPRPRGTKADTHRAIILKGLREHPQPHSFCRRYCKAGWGHFLAKGQKRQGWEIFIRQTPRRKWQILRWILFMVTLCTLYLVIFRFKSNKRERMCILNCKVRSLRTSWYLKGFSDEFVGAFLQL